MRWVAWLTLSAALCWMSGCGDDDDESTGSGGAAGASGSSGGTGGTSDASTAGSGGSTGGSAGAALGGYMQICSGDGGFECDPGLTCKQFLWTDFDGGVSQCGRRICTQPCDAGCPSPAIGCNGGTCEPPECYTP